jgi:hypothetical protein
MMSATIPFSTGFQVLDGPELFESILDEYGRLSVLSKSRGWNTGPGGVGKAWST